MPGFRRGINRKCCREIPIAIRTSKFRRNRKGNSEIGVMIGRARDDERFENGRIDFGNGALNVWEERVRSHEFCTARNRVEKLKIKIEWGLR